jgi:hypothetical protein
MPFSHTLDGLCFLLCCSFRVSGLVWSVGGDKGEEFPRSCTPRCLCGDVVEFSDEPFGVYCSWVREALRGFGRLNE